MRCGLKSLKIVVIPVTPLQQNCSLIVDAERSEGVIVDPGGDVALINDTVRKLGVQVLGIWLTHSHFDHCGGVAECLKCWPDAPLFAHPGETLFRSRAAEIAAMWNLPGFSNCPEPSRAVVGGETLSVGAHVCSVLFVPGHSPGHVAFYFKADKVLIAGDTLFQGSIGRTDLPGGDHQQLLDSIKREILTLPDDVLVYPGHGPMTSIGQERVNNPFL